MLYLRMVSSFAGEKQEDQADVTHTVVVLKGSALILPPKDSREPQMQYPATLITYPLPAAWRCAPAPPEPSSPPPQPAAPQQRWASGVLSRKTRQSVKGFRFLWSPITAPQHTSGAAGPKCLYKFMIIQLINAHLRCLLFVNFSSPENK